MIEPVAENIWIAEGDCVDFYGFPYPTRSILIRLKTGALWVWSPIKLTPGLKNEVDQLGEPAHLISPNKIHHLFLKDWKQAYPQAKLWGPKSVIKKRKDLTFEAPLNDEAPVAWRDDIDQVRFHGSPIMDEMVFFHRSSRTAILADLSENFSEDFLKSHWRLWQRILARLWGVVEGKGYAPLEWRLSFFNRRAARKARDRIIGWNPSRVIMAHGVWQDHNGAAFLKKSFQWVGK